MYGGNVQMQSQPQASKNPNRVAAGLRVAGVDTIIADINGQNVELALAKYVRALEDQIKKLQSKNRDLETKLNRLIKSNNEHSTAINNLTQGNNDR